MAIIHKVQCQCGDIRHYDSGMFYDDSCRVCNSLAFGLRKTIARIDEADLPEGIDIYTWYDTIKGAAA